MDLCVYEVALNGHVSLNGGQYNNARMQLHGLVCESKLVPYGGRHGLLKSTNVSLSTESRLTDGPDISESA